MTGGAASGMADGAAGQSVLALLALGAVVLLILGAARAARALPALAAVRAPDGAVMLRGTLALDRGRRLYLVEAAGCHTLVLTGGAADVMVSLQAPP